MKKYNHLYFTEKSREAVDIKNSNFWIHLSDLKNANPNIEIVTTETIKDKWGQFYSVLHFDCSNADVLEKIQSIYNNHWYPVPLELHPEFSQLNIEDILKE